MLKIRLSSNFLQAVSVGVPLHGILDGVGALEELFAGLVLLSSGVGIQVLVQKFPHVVGQAQDLKILGVSEKKENKIVSSKVKVKKDINTII